MKHDVIFALGTNSGKENIKKAQTVLQREFQDLKFSDIVPTDPIGIIFQRTTFYNTLANGTTSKDVAEVIRTLKLIEKECGDSRELRQNGTVVLDVDLLKFDECIFHEKDWNRKYIRELMSNM